MLDTPSRANARQAGSQQGPSAQPSNRIFLGGKQNPLLAPRGVHLVDGKLIVADTGQNRVFIWHQLPDSEHQEPDVVLGQAAKSHTERNAGGKVSASTLMYPSGLWSDGRRLVVCDAWNHRVLLWHRFPTADGQPADVVIGQRDFTGNQPNIEGIGSTPSAHSLNWPYGVDVEGERLFIADTGNRRILVFNQFPTENHAAADGVIGKDDFADRDYDHEQAIWPYSVNIGPNGELAITDTQYYRVLLYRSWQEAMYKQAPAAIIGQEKIADNGQNQYRWFPEAYTLNWCYDTLFYADSLYVADTGNSRVLRFDQLPVTNNQAADAVIGQANFNLGIENRNSIQATAESLYWPFHLSMENELMAIADTGNHRIILHNLKT